MNSGMFLQSEFMCESFEADITFKRFCVNSFMNYKVVLLSNFFLADRAFKLFLSCVNFVVLQQRAFMSEFPAAY